MNELNKSFLQLIEEYQDGERTAEDTLFQMKQLISEEDAISTEEDNDSGTSWDMFSGVKKQEKQIVTRKNIKSGISTANPDLLNIINDYALSNLGECMLLGDSIGNGCATTAISICRRRFKKEDILLLDILDKDQEAEEGIAFTKDSIYNWDEENGFVFEMKYADIDEVDYDEENVYLTTKDGTHEVLFCGDDSCEYSLYMYNFIMDIVDLFAKSSEE